MALDGRRTKAAALLGGGVPANRVAAEVGISARQLRRWRKEPDFAALEAASRGDVLAGSRTLRNVLEAALVAVTPKGAPDWSARLRAAQLLLSSAAALEELEAEADDDGPSRRIVIHRPDLLPPGKLEKLVGDGNGGQRAGGQGDGLVSDLERREADLSPEDRRELAAMRREEERKRRRARLRPLVDAPPPHAPTQEVTFVLPPLVDDRPLTAEEREALWKWRPPRATAAISQRITFCVPGEPEAAPAGAE